MNLSFFIFANEKNNENRLLVVQWIFIVFSFLILYRLISIQLNDHAFLVQESEKRVVRYEKIPAHRGVIYDRNNHVLAASAPIKSIWINPKILIDQPQHWMLLAKKLDLPLNKLQNKIIQNSQKEFIYLKKIVQPSDAKKILELNIPGVYSAHENKRFYPSGKISAHIVGLTDIDGKGQEGIELGFDSILSGNNGKIKLLKDKRGDLIEESRIIKSSQSGQNINLSIDIRFQHIAYKALANAVQKHDAISGSAVMLNVETGEILAMVNYPSYNPNERISTAYINMRNRAITDSFEPGSTLKPFIISAAMNSGAYKAMSIIDTGVGYLRVGSNEVRDINGYGKINLEQVLAKSSNVGMSKIAMDIGANCIISMLSKVGIGQSIMTGFPGEKSGSVPYFDHLNPFQLSTLSFGYGITVTPLQLAQAYLVLASGGIFRPVTMLKSTTPLKEKIAMKEEVANSIVKMMESVVHSGSGRKAKLTGYKVSGKTGTVRKVGRHGYSDKNHIGFFAGIVPAEQPKLVTVVVIDNPKNGQFYGGQIAAPVFSEINTQVLRLLNIKPSQALIVKSKNNQHKNVW